MADLSMSFDPNKISAASDAASDAISKANASLSNASDAQSAATAYLDQSVKQAASPTFNNISLTGNVSSNLNGVKVLWYGANLIDDGTYTLPTLNAAIGAFGMVQCKDDNYAVFYVNSGNTVVLLHSDNAVANADTDNRLCIGTAAAQNPLIIKNRSGGTRYLTVFFMYYA